MLDAVGQRVALVGGREAHGDVAVVLAVLFNPETGEVDDSGVL